MLSPPVMTVKSTSLTQIKPLAVFVAPLQHIPIIEPVQPTTAAAALMLACLAITVPSKPI